MTLLHFLFLFAIVFAHAHSFEAIWKSVRSKEFRRHFAQILSQSVCRFRLFFFLHAQRIIWAFYSPIAALGNGYSVVKVRLKGFKIPLTCLNWESKKSGFFEKIFCPSLVWNGRAVSGGYFSKKFLSLYLFGQRVVKCTPKMSSSKEMFIKNSHILLSGNIYSFTYLELKVVLTPYFR